MDSEKWGDIARGVHRLAANTEPGKLAAAAGQHLAALALQHSAVIVQIQGSMDEKMGCDCDRCKDDMRRLLGDHLRWHDDLQKLAVTIKLLEGIGFEYDIPDPRVIEKLKEAAFGQEQE